MRRSIIMDAKADLLVYGMGERPLVEIVRRLAAGESVRQLRDIRGVAYRLGASEAADIKPRPSVAPADHVPLSPGATDGRGFMASSPLVLPSYEEVSADKAAFVAMTRMIHEETNPYNARPLVQYHGREAVVVNPPAWPLAQEEMDRVYDLPFTRRPHPSYGRRRIPAFEVVRDSIQIIRGCFGGCSFCSITLHEGRIVQSRSQESILAEIGRMAEQPDFTGTISDLGGPTANMYQMNCSRPEAREKCRRSSCLWPDDLPAADDRPRAADPAVERGAGGAGGEAGVGGLGHPHGPGAAEPGLHPPRRPAPHRRAVEGRPRTFRPGGPAADAQAADRAVRGVRPRVQPRIGRRGQAAVPRALFHRRPSGQRSCRP